MHVWCNYLSDEETVFSTQTIDSSNLTDIYGNTVEGPTDEDEDEAVEEGGQSDPSDSEIAANNAINNTSTNTSNDNPEVNLFPSQVAGPLPITILQITRLWFYH